MSEGAAPHPSSAIACRALAGHVADALPQTRRSAGLRAVAFGGGLAETEGTIALANSRAGVSVRIMLTEPKKPLNRHGAKVAKDTML